MTLQPHAELLTIGTPEFLRYVIVADGTAPAGQLRYWTGATWTKDLGQACLYAERGFAWRDVAKIRTQK